MWYVLVYKISIARKSLEDPNVSGRSLLTMYLLLVRRRYSRGMAEDTPAESNSPGEALIDLAPIKTEHSESPYRIYTSMRIDGRGELNSLTIVTKPSPHESNLGGFDPCLYSCVGDLCSGTLETPVLLFMYASSVRHASRNLRLVALPSYRPEGSTTHQQPARLDAVIPTVECHPGLHLRR